MEYRPHDYQAAAYEFILDHEKAGLMLDMGLGKTVKLIGPLPVVDQFTAYMDKIREMY